MTLYRLRLTLDPNTDGVFTVTSPDVPGLVTEGSTAAEIQSNVQDAMVALLEAWHELGKPIPSALQPLTVDTPQNVEILVAA